MDGNRGHHAAQSPFVAERVDEGAVLELGPDLRRDPAADEDASDRQRLQRQVAGLGAVARDERLERLDRARVTLIERRLGDRRARVTGLHPRAEPLRLRPTAARQEESIDVVEPGPGDDTLVADAPELLSEKPEELGLELGARREIRVAAFRADDAMSPAVPHEEDLAEPRTRRDQRHRRLARLAGLKRRER